MDLFKLVGSIFIKSEDANEEIDNVKEKAKDLATTVGKSISDAGTKISSIGTKMLPVTVAIGGIGAVAVKSSAEMKALNSQFEQTFGDLQSQATEAINGVATESGILQTRLQGIGTSIYAFAKSSGADSAEAMSLMETALKATADASAYYDRSLEDTSESLMSFLKGNYENDSALGLSCTETTRNAKAMEMFGKEFNDLSEIQKQQTLLKMVTDSQKLSGAMGQASRESDGFENVTGNLNESVKLLGAEFGEVLLPTVVSLVQKATAFLQKLSQMDDGTKKMIVTATLLVGAIAPVLVVVGKVMSVVGTIITVMPKIVSGVKLIGTGLKALWGIISANPVGVIITIIGVLIGVFIHLWNTSEEFRNFWINLWDNIKSIVSTVVNAVVTFLTNAWNSIKTTVENVFNGIITFFQNVWNTIKNVVQVALMFIVEIITTYFELITLPFRFIWENCKGIITEVWNAIKTFITTAIDAVKTTITNVLTAIQTVFSNIWNAIKNNIITPVFNSIKTVVTNVMNAVKSVISTVMNAIKSVFSTVWNAIKSVVTTVLNSIKSVISNVMNAVKSVISNAWNSIKSTVSGAINGVKNTISNGLNSAKNTVSNVLNSIKSKFSSIMNGAKNIVSGAISKIKGFFNFNWSLPKLKLPHFSLTGKFSLTPPSVPKFSIEWYKHGGIMTEPTLFDYNPLTGKARVGGEAGDEAIAPIDLLQGYVATAVASQYNIIAETLENLFGKLFEILERYFPEFTKQVVLDTGVLVGELAPKMDTELGKIMNHKGRGN